ncbi:MAG: T9SS type A sorting domain-containing protein [bacterium]|nr:T9SS type A sorting domain-containing protein [bacterium]
MPPSRILTRSPDGTRALRLAVSVMLGIASIATAGFATPSLDTLVLSVGGVSVPGPAGCTSFLAPSSLIGFFGDYGLGLPVGGLAVCGVPGGVDELTSPTGPLVDERSLVNSWPNGSFNGTSSVAAEYGRLSSSAQANYAGDTSSLNVIGSEGFTIAADGFTITTPSFADGQAGTVVFRTTVNGSLSTTGTGTAGLRLDYHVNAGAGVSMLRASVNGAASLPALASIGNIGLDGFARTPGHLDGSGEVVTVAIPIVFGTRFEYRLGLLVYAVPALTALVQSDFDAAITAIEVKGPGGVVVSDFTVTSDSGTSYGAGGVVAVGDDPHGGIGNPSRLSAFPNPSGTAIQLRFSLKRAMATSLDIFDSAGRRVKHIGNAGEGTGDQSAIWDGRGDGGVALSSGVYFARLSWQGGFETTRVTLLR